MKATEFPDNSVVDLHLKKAAGDELELIYVLVDPRSYEPTESRYSQRATADEVFRTFAVTRNHWDKVLCGVGQGRTEHLTRTTL